MPQVTHRMASGHAPIVVQLFGNGLIPDTIGGYETLQGKPGIQESLLSRQPCSVVECDYVPVDFASETSVVPPALVNQIARCYLFADRRRVTAFIEQHPNIAAVLVDGFPEIAGRFPRAILKVSVEVDPEIPGRSQLYLAIETDLSPREANDLLADLDEGWYYRHMDEVGDDLCLDVDYR